jgi:tripeptidyl-peptidase I
MKILLLLLIVGATLANITDWKKIDRDVIEDEKITFYLAIKQNQYGLDKLQKYILEDISNIDSPLYGQYMSRKEINGLVAPSGNQINSIKAWLNSNSINDCKFFGDVIRCTEHVNRINKLLGIKMSWYHNVVTRKNTIGTVEPYSIPENLKDTIEFIDGISNRLNTGYKYKYKYKPIGSDDVSNGGFSREVMLRLYNISDNYINKNSSVGAIEYSRKSGFSNKDLLNSQLGNGVNSNLISKNHLIGVNYDTPDIESELDVQVMYWGAPDAELWYEQYVGWMYGWAVDFFNRENVPEVVSISWGLDETQQCDVISCENTTSERYVKRSNAEFMKLVARGITLVVASGDAGSPGRSNEFCESNFGPYGWNHINADFPGGSPWVLSVGATYLVKNDKIFNYTTPICTNYSTNNITCSNGVEERGIFYNKTEWTTGGAFTHWDETPIWQVQNVKDYLNSKIVMPDSKYFNRNGRAYPDVSTVGHNCLVNLRDGTGLGTWTYVDGTSCSAPVFAGIITQLNSFQKERGKPVLGYINPLLYKMYAQTPKTFNDITQGTTQCTEYLCCLHSYGCCTHDFGFQATKGWDPVSGLGSPNVYQIKQWLSNY